MKEFDRIVIGGSSIPALILTIVLMAAMTVICIALWRGKHKARTNLRYLLAGAVGFLVSARVLELGVPVGLTDHALLHDEGEFSWRRHLRKKGYYSGFTDVYRDKWHNDAVIRRQLGFGYRFFGVFFLVRHISSRRTSFFCIGPVP